MPESPTVVISAADDAWRAYWVRALAAPVVAAGAEVRMLWDLDSEAARRETLRSADGLLLGGGFDIDPRLYGEEPGPLLGPLDPKRDAIELPLVREALALGLPLLGVCRGMQVISVCLGGTMYQDTSENPGAEDHPTGLARGFAPVVAAELAGEPPPQLLTHPVTTAAGSTTAALLGAETSVNSYHHQHLRDLPDGVVATARAADGVVEAIELPDAPGFALGVQWELQAGWREDAGQFGFYVAFVAAARARSRAES